jgi:dihydrodipicolinate synthase/N-acetylneuraminate lyase
VTQFASSTVQSLIQDPIGNYPFSTVACFDATTGALPRRQLDHDRMGEFLVRIDTYRPDALLIGASTGQGHLRTFEELEEWFRVAAAAKASDRNKFRALLAALVRPEDGSANDHLLNVLAELGYPIIFVRPGTNLGFNPTDEAIVANMRPLVAGAAERGLAVGLYSISDVSGCPMSPDVAAELVAGPGGDHIVAIKVTEANYENSTLRFLDDLRLAHLKIVQGWDPHLSRALQDGPRHDITRRQRCGFTSGAMSFAINNYVEIAKSAQAGNWDEVADYQQAVTTVFAAMQDDPTKFADLQRAKFIMGLGHPITRDITPEQVERVFAALEGLPKSAGKICLAWSLKMMSNCPYEERLTAIIQSAKRPD